MNKDTFFAGLIGAYAVILVGAGIYLARAALDRRFQALGYQITGAQYIQRSTQPVPVQAPTGDPG